MKRRDFSISLAGGGLGLWLAGAARAQGAPVEGTHYLRLAQPAPVTLTAPGKKVEVVEFFWYECPHCNTFEPLLAAWSRTLPADVELRHVPVGFTARHQVAQKAYYALEEMGKAEALHRPIFTAIHVERQRLQTEQAFVEFVAKHGVDAEKFRTLMRSFSVNTKAVRARQLTDAYKVDGTPSLGVQGRYYISGGLAGGYQGMLAVADHLIGVARRG